MATNASKQSPDTPVTMATGSASMTTDASQQSNLGAPTTSKSSSIREAAPQLASSVFTETPQSSTLTKTTTQPSSGLQSSVKISPLVTSDVRTTPKTSPSTKTVLPFAVSASLAEPIVHIPSQVTSDVRTSPKTSPKTKTVSQHTLSAENVTRIPQTVSDGKVTSLQHSKTPGRVNPCGERLEPTGRKLEVRDERSEVKGERSLVSDERSKIMSERSKVICERLEVTGKRSEVTCEKLATRESQENDLNLPASVQAKSVDKTIDLPSAVPEQAEVLEKEKALPDRSELPQSVHHNISSSMKIMESPSTQSLHMDAPETSEISNEELPGFLLLSSDSSKANSKQKVQCELCKKTMFSTSAPNHRLLHERRGEAFPKTDPRPLGDLPGSSKGDLSRSSKGDPSRSSEAGSEERVYMRTRSGSIIKTTSTILSSPDAKTSSGKTKEVEKDSHITIRTSGRRKSLRMIESKSKTTVIAKNTKLDNHKIDNEDCNDVNDDVDEVTISTEKKVGDKEPSLPWPRVTEHSKGRRTILKEKMRNSLKRGRCSSEKVEGATHSVTRILTRNSMHVKRPAKVGQNSVDEICDESVIKRSKTKQEVEDESEASKGQRKCKICQKKLNSNEAQLRHNVLEHGADPASLITPDMTILHKCNTCDIVYPHLSMLLEHKEREKHFLKIFLKKVEKGEQGSDQLQEDVSADALKDSVATYIEETNNPLREKFIRDLEAAKLGKGPKPGGLRPRKFFQCKLGDYKPVPSNRLYALRAHILQVHLKTKPLKCQYCDHRSVDEYSLSVHMRTHTGEKNFMCAVCKKCFSLRRTCQKHQRDDHGMKISAKLSVSKRADKPNHKRKKQNCDNVCEKCGRHFLTSNFYLHRKYCQLNLTFACDQCDKVYKTKQGLDRHVKVDHGAVKEQYVCDVCKRSFKYRATVVEHMRMYHLERPIKCEHCDASFIKQSSLDEHLRKHLGKRPFRCEICDKSFVRKTLLLRHKESHLTERNVVCDVCNKAFKSKTSLQQHKKIHSTVKKYRCDICDARFSLHGTYFIHMKRHRGQKDHKCRFCNMAFVTSGDRIRHEKTHTKETIDKNGETPLSISFKNGKKAKLQQVETVTAFDDLVVNTIILPVEGATSVDEPTQDASEKEVGEILYVVSGQHDIVGGATEISVPRVDSEGGVEEIVYVMSGPQEGPVITLT